MEPAVNNIQRTLFGLPFPKITYRRHWSHAVEDSEKFSNYDKRYSGFSSHQCLTKHSPHAKKQNVYYI